MDEMNVTKLAEMAGVSRETASRAINRKSVTPSLAAKLGEVTRAHLTAEDWYTMTPGQKKRAFGVFVKFYNCKSLRCVGKGERRAGK